MSVQRISQLVALELFRAGKARPTSRGERYLREEQQLGIPAGVMASTPPVVNTAEEAVAIRRLLEASGNASVSASV
jgi:hypothetical protein